ncbi:hypothetical protein [Burkholderia cenocepacia]|uniref:hypothetical protein n=1 Tax=Burkholderia cenocepacia TaxID=95486 RepID=UPI0011777F22|nr:hypothetical protein [Burkholderia cenocepacia]
MNEKNVTATGAKAGLSRLIHEIRGGTSSLFSVRDWLLQQLSAQEYAKLGQGGHTQNQIPLRQVFIDLPVTDSPNVEMDQMDREPFLKGLLSSKALDLAAVTHFRKFKISENIDPEIDDQDGERDGEDEVDDDESWSGPTYLRTRGLS